MERSADLDRVRQLLFPDLPAEEGWARIDSAFDGAGDPKRLAAIEDLADGYLDGDLAAIVRRLRDREPLPPAA